MFHSFDFRKASFVLALAAVSQGVQALPARIATTHVEALQMLQTATGGAVTDSVRPVDFYSAVHAVGQQLLLRDDARQLPLARAQNFLSLYGGLAGVKDPIAELRLARVSRDLAGNDHVHLDQTYRGLPVFGARLVVHMNNEGVTGTNGVFLDDIGDLDTTPAMEAAALESRALAATRKLHPKATLAIESTRLMVYRTGLLKGVEGRNYLAYEVIVRGQPGEAVREQIILNANTGNILNRIDRIETVLNREIHTPTIDTPPVLTEGSALAPSDPAFVGDTKGSPASTRTHGPGTVPTDNLYIYAGGTYNLYKNMFGVEGYDYARPANPQVQHSVYLVNQQCPNAYWDGTSTNYCPGFDADDVVSHEWSHAYTQYTDGLVYQYQSGALNESNSDIFGETYDLINGFEGPLGATLTEGKTYDNRGSRWVVGEDLSEAAAALLLRDMWDPDNFPSPSPGSTITSSNYYCSTGDNGGVHTNSGVSNHAYAMLVDGKKFNGYTVPGIGLIKAAHIYFQAKTHYGTPTQNFAQHADGLEQACKDLIGKPLNDVFGKVSDQVINAADCDAVHTVALAVEFRGRPDHAGTTASPQTVAQKCNYIPVLKPEAGTPALCPSGQYVAAKFHEGFDGSVLPSGWTQGKKLTGDTDIAPWTISKNLPSPHSGSAAFFKNDTGGTCASGGDQSASHYLDSPKITVSSAADFFSFTHFVQSESGFDGAQLRYSLNGGAFALVPDAAFTYNGHSGSLGDGPLFNGAPADPTGLGLLGGNNTNPNAGQKAWTGSDQGEATGSWGTTIVNLAKLSTAAKAGDTVQFRFDFSNDGCGGNLGWFVDDAKEFICTTTPPVNTPPVASLALDKSSGPAPLTVQFTVGGSDLDSGNGDKLVGYSLSFGDGSAVASGTFDGASSKTVSHTFSTAGVYNVTLTVTDSASATSQPALAKVEATGSGGSGGGGSVPGNGGSSGSSARGRLGGGALGWLALLPLAAAGLRRRRH
jgi:bacillolysin